MSAIGTFEIDYATATQRCGLRDRSERGKLALTGSGAGGFLQGQVSNDVLALTPVLTTLPELLTTLRVFVPKRRFRAAFANRPPGSGGWNGPDLIPLTGFGFVTALLPLTAYTLLILFRNVIAGLDNVPAEPVRRAQREFEIDHGATREMGERGPGYGFGSEVGVEAEQCRDHQGQRKTAEDELRGQASDVHGLVLLHAQTVPAHLEPE